MKNILLVDDNKTNILLLETMLDDAGYTSIYSCLSAKEAYKKLEKYKFDIILLDIGMPDIDGIEACRTIREMPKYKRVPIIMVTANDSDENLSKSFDAGANDFVTKPVNFINLNSRMKNLFSHQEKDMLIMNQIRVSAMNEIIEVLAHQWRQPLATISSSAIHIQVANELGKLNSTEIESNMTKISDYAQELSKTIDEIRDVSKTDEKALHVDINKLVKHALSVIQKSYKSRDIALQMKEKELEEILTFPNEFVRVLLNIFINSQEAFIRNKKDSKKVIQIETMQDSDSTTIIIRDNAGGIKPENLSKVFDPYYSTKYEKNGKGLGLYNCKQIIEQHQGGKLNISSNDSITEVKIELLNDFKEPLK